jgi:AcrR family transcriptional regulator
MSERSHCLLAFRTGGPIPPRVVTRPRKRPRQERSRQTVEAILAAAARILVRHGYDRTSTNRVAQAAGVSIGSLYQYFPSKEALVAALIERHIDRVSSAMEAALDRLRDAPVPTAAAALVQLMIDVHAVDPALHRVLHEQVPRVGRLELFHDIERRMMALTRSYLELHRSELRPGLDLDLAVPLVVQTVEAVSHAAVLHRPDLLVHPRLADEITELVVRYLTDPLDDAKRRRDRSAHRLVRVGM